MLKYYIDQLGRMGWEFGCPELDFIGLGFIEHNTISSANTKITRSIIYNDTIIINGGCLQICLTVRQNYASCLDHKCCTLHAPQQFT